MRGLWTVKVSLVASVVTTLVIAAPAPISAAACPLNFTVLDEFPFVATQVRTVDALDKKCLILSHGLDVLLSVYLQRTGYFLPPTEAAQPCIQAVEGYFRVRNITGLCGVTPASISRGTDNCQGIATADDFRNIITSAGVASSLDACNNGGLANGNTKSATCAACTKALTLVANSLRSSGNGGEDQCLDYTGMYTGAEVVNAGPADATTLVCLWEILSNDNSKQRQWWLYLVIGAVVIFLASSSASVAFLWVRRRKANQSDDEFVRRTKSMLHGSMGEHGGGLTWYSIEELRAATRNFDAEMIIGQGGFGNVYKGILRDGHEVACKRFKDCTAAGDTSFLHEVQALASVRHKNLVALRGCCIASLAKEGFSGHQRIIVLDYVKNGSLQDHLFSTNKLDPVLTWPQRHKIATDTARGIDYLHSGAQAQILHRDIKPSNILLDADFNAMVADFGLVKFTPNGMTHVTTRVAGSFGYVAPEYAMYNQLTDRSDVYSFGIVLLELVSGRRAMTPDPVTEEPPIDWAWRLIKEGNWAEILDKRMITPTLDKFELERFVMLALLCAHPQVFYRPTMTSVLRMLENAQHVPPLPNRPVPVTFSKAAFQAALATSSASSLQSGSFVPSFSTVSG